VGPCFASQEVLRRGKVLFGLRDFEAATEQYEAALRLVMFGSGGPASTSAGASASGGASASAGAGAGAGSASFGAASGVVCGAGSAGGGSGGSRGGSSATAAVCTAAVPLAAAGCVTVGCRVLVAPAGDVKRPPRPAFVSIVDDDDCTADVMYEDGDGGDEEDGVSFTRLTLIGDGKGPVLNELAFVCGPLMGT
jgi:hypothetical protein